MPSQPCNNIFGGFTPTTNSPHPHSQQQHHQQQVPLTTTTIDESTPFIAASDGNLPLLIESLTKLSLPITISDSNGLTLLHSAASYNQIHILKWIFEQQQERQSNVIININVKDNDGDTPLHHCDTLSAVKCLIEDGGADWKVENNDGDNVLDMKEEELREYYCSDENRNGIDDDDDDEEDIQQLKLIIKYLKGLDENNNN